MSSGAPPEEAASQAVDGRTARWSGQRDKRRAEFVEAALEAIVQYGPQASIEQVADHVGVTRTKLYRYFDGAADLHHSVARRVSDMLTTKQTLVWNGPVSPMQVVRSTVSMHVRWRIEHPNLYEYLTRHPLSDDADGVSAINDVNSTVAANLGWSDCGVLSHARVRRAPGHAPEHRCGRVRRVRGDPLAQGSCSAAPAGIHHTTRRMDVVAAELRAAQRRDQHRPSRTHCSAGPGGSVSR